MSERDYTIGDLVVLITSAERGPMPMYRKRDDNVLIRCGECAVGEKAIVLGMEELATRLLTTSGSDGWVHPAIVGLVQRRQKTG